MGDHGHRRCNQPSRPTANVNALATDRNAQYRLLLPSQEGTRPTGMREHENLMPSPVQTVHAAVTEPVHDSSGQEHGFWWSIEKVRLAARESDHFGRSYAQAHKVRWSNVHYMR